MAKEIKLQNGMVALVDDEDFERVNEYFWSISVAGGSSLSIVTNVDGKRLTLSRFILNAKDGERVICKNGDRLDCRKENISIGSYSNVVTKVRGNVESTSKYKGVHWSKQMNKWVANIRANRKTINLGAFHSEDEAAKAYNSAALKFFGNQAYQNTIGEDNSAKRIVIERRKQHRSNGKYGFRGVSKSGEKWKVQIVINQKAVYLGLFITKEDAAKAYDQKAFELFGEKAILNFPENTEEYKTGGL